MDEVRIRLFGPPEVTRAGSVLHFDTRKAVALLAHLAVTGRPQTRETAAALLWPGGDHARARASLRRTLSVMSTVGPALVVGRSEIRLDAALASSDVLEFGRLAGSDDPDAWRRAAALAGQPFLAGFSLRDSPAFDEWQLTASDSLRDALGALLSRLTAASVSAGDLPEARTWAERRIAVEPFSEPAHAELIRLTAWTGDRPGALRLYRSLVRMLDRELGVPPLPATVALQEAIRADRLDPVTSPESRAATSAAPRRRIETLTEPPALAGRDAERDGLRTTWRRATDHGQVVGLVGDRGIGRTALADDLASHVSRSGGLVLRLRGSAAEQDLAFAAAADLAGALLRIRPDLRQRDTTGEVSVLLPPEPGTAATASIESAGALHRLFEAARHAVADVAAGALAGSPSVPALLVVDDAHLLDAPSADLLGFLTRRQPRGLMTLVTWTTEGSRTRLPSAVRDVADGGGVRSLAALDLGAVATLLARLGRAHDDPRDVLQRTGGVPLLVVEHAAASDTGADGADEPGGAARDGLDVRGLAMARLDAAPSTTRQLVGAAAVVGTVADPELLRLICGRDEAETVDAIEDAVQRRLLVELTDPPGYVLPHDVLRDATLSRTSLARARLLHGRAADALQRRHALQPLAVPAGAVARHLAAAGRTPEAAGWYWTAAQESIRLFAHAEAASHLRSALALGHDPLLTRCALGEVLVRTGRYGEALAELEQAAAAAEADRSGLAAVEHLIAGVHDRRGDPRLAEAHLRAALDAMPADHGPGRASATADLALVLHRQGRDHDAEQHAREALALAPGEVDQGPAARARALNVLGVVLGSRGDAHAAAECLSEAVALARRAGDVDLLGAALNNLSHARAGLGLGDDALAAAAEALALVEQQGDRHRTAALHSHLADLLHAAGREDEAIGHLKESARAFAALDGSDTRPEIWTLAEW